MSTVTVHSTIGSPPCRAVLLTAKALGIQLKVKEVNVLGGETRAPEFQRANPQHTIPLMEDKGLVLAESRAIMQYLVDAYGKSDSLYPRDIKLRAITNARLYFDASTLYNRLVMAYIAPLVKGFEQTPASLDLLKDSVSVLDQFIGEEDYLVGKRLTIADISIAVTISNLEAFKFDLTPYTNISRWLKNMKKVIPGYEEINQKGSDMLGNFWAQKFGNN